MPAHKKEPSQLSSGYAKRRHRQTLVWLPRELTDALKPYAVADNRTITNYITHLVTQHLNDLAAREKIR